MLPENENMSDLEYLADLGFERSGFDARELDEITRKVRARAFGGGGSYFVYISALVGVFAGVSVFFNFYNAPKISNAPAMKTLAGKTRLPEAHTEIRLDTITVTQDNFTRHAGKPGFASRPGKNISDTIEQDAAVFMASIPLPEIEEKLSEQKIHYSPNAPVVFIYDYKITDYYKLYFNRTRLVSLRQDSHVPVVYANREDMGPDQNFLDQRGAYFLHEALGDALLYFRKKDYSRCISLLNEVGSYTGFDVNCRFYLGMCHYCRKNYTEAINNFNACIANQNNVFLPEAEYYKALSFYESGRRDEAMPLFKKIADEEGFYSEKAKEYLK